MTDIYLKLTSEQLEQAKQNAQLLIVHPNYLTQRYILDDLLASTGNTVYLRFDGTDLDGESARTQLQQALDQQLDGQDGVSAVSNLVLDECDRVDDDALSQFVDDLAEMVIEQNDGRISVITRRTPRTLLNQLAARHQSQLIPVQNDLLLCNYIRDENESHLLEVHSFGSGRVYLDGVEIETWDGVLPRSLFFYLVDRGMTTRDDIFKIFWPTLTTKEATNVFHVTKRKISEVLGVDLTTYWSGFYRISPDIELCYDAMYFAKLVQDSAIADDDEAQNLLRRAIALYRGEFLTTLDLEWTRARRQSLLQTYGEALVTLGKMAHARGDKREALGLFLRSALTNPQREDLVRDIMELYADLGMVEDALASYERLEQELENSLEVPPTPELAQYADTLRAELS